MLAQVRPGMHWGNGSRCFGWVLMLGSAAISVRSVKARARITNNLRELHGVDGRSAEGKRYRDLLDSLIGFKPTTLLKRGDGSRAAANAVAAPKALIAIPKGFPSRLAMICMRCEA
jgi:hypothetical protein